MATQLRETSFAEMRAAMVDCQLRTNDVIDPAIVAAMGRVAREQFVPAELASLAYIDRAIELGGGRRLNPPLVTARLLVAAEVAAGHRVLLIGAATGYAAALLVELGGDVTAVESDLPSGMAAGAPYDRIIIDGAVEHVPDMLTAQLAEGGVLVCALSEGPVTRLARGVKIAGTLSMRAFADMDAVALPGFARAKPFTF